MSALPRQRQNDPSVSLSVWPPGLPFVLSLARHARRGVAFRPHRRAPASATDTPSTGWSTGRGCGGETEVAEGGVAGRRGLGAGQDERPRLLVGAGGGVGGGWGRGEAVGVVFKQRGGSVEDGGGDGVPGDDRPGRGEMAAGVGVAG